MTGFFEEAPGVRSMTRLAIAVLLACTVALTGATCWYLVRGTAEAAVVASLAGFAGALVLNGVVAIAKRNGGTEVDMSGEDRA